MIPGIRVRRASEGEVGSGGPFRSQPATLGTVIAAARVPLSTRDYEWHEWEVLVGWDDGKLESVMVRDLVVYSVAGQLTHRGGIT